jgi:hypothetical protein
MRRGQRAVRGEAGQDCKGEAKGQAAHVTETVTKLLVFIGVATALAAWLFTVYHMIRMARSSNPSAPVRWFVRANPFNVVMCPDDLTPEGRRYRKRFLFSAALFLVSIFATVAIGMSVKP